MFFSSRSLSVCYLAILASLMHLSSSSDIVFCSLASKHNYWQCVQLALLKVKCWQIRRQTKAPQAAGAIHTDFERGFICAEVVLLSFVDIHLVVQTFWEFFFPLWW